MTAIQFRIESQPGSVLSMAEDLELWGMEEKMMQPLMDKASKSLLGSCKNPPRTLQQFN